MDQVKNNKLAYEIASVLEDTAAIDLHIAFCKKYSEEFLRGLLQKVLSIPEAKIKRSRAALYTYLVQAHGRSNSRH